MIPSDLPEWAVVGRGVRPPPGYPSLGVECDSFYVSNVNEEGIHVTGYRDGLIRGSLTLWYARGTYRDWSADTSQAQRWCAFCDSLTEWYSDGGFKCRGCTRNDGHEAHLFEMTVLAHYATSDEKVVANFAPGWRTVMRKLEDKKFLAYRGADYYVTTVLGRQFLTQRGMVPKLDTTPMPSRFDREDVV